MCLIAEQFPQLIDIQRQFVFGSHNLFYGSQSCWHENRCDSLTIAPKMPVQRKELTCLLTATMNWTMRLQRRQIEWEEFRDGDGDPIGIRELKCLNLKDMPEDVFVRVMDDYFPETTLTRDGELFICEIEEHLYTKYWEHKFSAYAFAEAMERAVRHPISFTIQTTFCCTRGCLA